MISIVLVSTILLVSINASASLLRNNSQQRNTNSSTHLAAQILDEVSSMDFRDRVDPVFGIESDENASDRNTFDDVDDYALEGRSYAGEVQRIRGGALTYDHAGDLLSDLAAKSLPHGTVRLEGSIFHGEPYLIAWHRDGEPTRLDALSLQTRPLADSSFAKIAAVIRPGEPIRAQGWLTEGDAYYYSHHDEKSFPVYRIQYEDGERVYLDRVTGQLAFAADGNRQLSRWLFLGLHRGDLSGLMRQRPLWDLLLLPLLAGVTLGALTGTWMGIKRLVR